MADASSVKLSSVKRETHDLDAYESALDEAEHLADLGGIVFRLGDPHYRLTGLLQRACGLPQVGLDVAARIFAAISHPHDAAETVRLLRSFERFDPYDGELRLSVDGTHRRFHLRTTVVRAAHGYPTGIVGLAEDVTTPA